MPGIDRAVTQHNLKISRNHKPVIQKKRCFAPERQEAIQAEVDKLMKARFVRPRWLANVVMVKKANGKWRMCVDYTDLNKACPKDSYPLPKMDQLVDNSSEQGLLSFMDAYSGYNQRLMNRNDEEDTSFITPNGIYCYKVMPFGLKNAGATYQRLVNVMFKQQLGINMEAYVDDLLAKSKRPEDHTKDLMKEFKHYENTR